MSQTTAQRPGYDVGVKCVTVHDPRGFPYYLGQGEALPSWVSDEELAALLEAGALFTFEVI